MIYDVNIAYDIIYNVIINAKIFIIFNAVVLFLMSQKKKSVAKKNIEIVIHLVDINYVNVP